MLRSSPFWQIFRFELAYQLRQPAFWVCSALFSLLAFGAVSSDAVTIGGSVGNVARNAPYVIQQILLIMGILGVFATTAFVATAAIRDPELGTHALFFTTPISEGSYLFGRFFGGLVAAFGVFVATTLGILLGSLMPWLEAERVLPFDLVPYLYSLGALVLPSLLLTGALFFAVALKTRSMFAAYAAAVGFFVAYIVAGNFLSDLETEALGTLLDPFGLAAFASSTKYWTTVERNTLLVPLEGAFLASRLLWTGLGLAVLGWAWARFRFAEPALGRRERRRLAAAAADDRGAPAPTGAAPARPLETIDLARPEFDRRTPWVQLWHRSRHETAAVLGSIAFLVMAALGVFNLYAGADVLDNLYGTPVYPVTHLLVSLIQDNFSLFAFLVVIIYAAELVWRDRTQGVADVVDALPVPHWVLWLSKLLAVTAAAAVLLLLGTATAILIQLIEGGAAIDLALYGQGVFGIFGIFLVQVLALALFFQALAHNKYLGLLLLVLYFISMPVMAALDLTHNLYLYGQTPEAPYSDMNGYGPFVTPVLWFNAYWSLGAGLLLVAVHLFWVRGRDTDWRSRLSLARQRFTPAVRAVTALLLVGFLATGAWIFYNTNVLNEHVSGDEALDRLAAYETEYQQWERFPQPKITAVTAEVDIYPERRETEIRGTYRLVNRTEEPIDALHVSLNPDVTLRSLTLPGARLEHEDRLHGFSIYRLEEPLAPGEETTLRFEVARETRGFVNAGTDTRLVANGSFFNNFQYFPYLGYDPGLEITDPNERRKRGLPPPDRMADLEDEAARQFNAITPQSDWIDFETVVSTSADQVALAPGNLVREWTEGERRYFHYRMKTPILGFFAYLSGDWERTSGRWNDVAIDVYHHPDHDWNVPRMIEAVQKTLDYTTAELSPYQHDQVRILEFPRYEQFAQSFPNTIPFSESIGFIARLEDREEIDYVFYVTAHEIAHQWWAHQVISGAVQGSAVLTETLSQYTALMVMEKEYGPEMMRRFLRYELDRYLRGRGDEQIEEMPLERVENQGYIHYRKGSLAMYVLRDRLGEDAVNRALRRLIEDTALTGPPYPTSRDLVERLLAEAPPEHHGLIRDLFETITLWEHRAVTAEASPTGDGRWRVRLAVAAEKLRADGQGEETPLPVDTWVDVAVFGEPGAGTPPEGEVLAFEQHHLTGPEATFELVVDREPRQAGVDPFHKLIDRNPENNLIKVGAASGR